MTQVQTQTVNKKQIVIRGLRGHCPNCGKQKIHRSWFRLHRRCPSCGLLIIRGQGGFLGAATWNYGLVVFGLFPIYLVLGISETISWDWVARLCLATSILGPILFYPLSWSLWLLSYYFFLPHELPNNGGENAQYDEDD